MKASVGITLTQASQTGLFYFIIGLVTTCHCHQTVVCWVLMCEPLDMCEKACASTTALWLQVNPYDDYT